MATAASAALLPTLALPGGVLMPCIGLGTFKARGADATAAVRTALRLGIRHIDTASVYKVRGRAR